MILRSLIYALGFSAALLVAAGKDEPAVLLDPMVVSTESLLSFGFGLRVVRSHPDNRVLGMYVERVGEGTDAFRKGLITGAQVLRIDGRPVSDYEGTFRSGSELNRIFIGRSSGDRISLEVMLPGKKKPKKLTITRRVVNREYPKIGGMPLD